MSFDRPEVSFVPAVLGLFAILALALPGAAFAGPGTMSEGMRSPTPTVYIDLLYHKLTKQTPDYDAWAFQTEEYKTASEHDKPIIFTTQRNQLEDLYEDLDVEEYIVVRTMVNCAKAYSDLQQTFFFAEFDDETFIEFSSTQDDRKYALVLKGIEKYGKIEMQADKAQEMLVKLGHGGDAHAEIIVKPLLADAQVPFEYDGESYWLLMGEVAEFSLWSDRRVKEKVWSDRAKWYVEENPLLDLYDIPKKN